MVGGIVSSPRGALSTQQALKLAKMYLENAHIADDGDIALVLCHDTEVSLSNAKKAARRMEDQCVIGEIGTAYVDLGKLLESRGYVNEARVSYKKAGKLGVHATKVDVQDSGRFAKTGRAGSIMSSLKATSLSTGTSESPSSANATSLDNQRR
ncbi:hypothetical protein BGX34_004274, partial [Mortierella sp. NVP85]